MIDLYTWITPNGRKVSIPLEELGVPYTVYSIDISKDEQFDLEFLKISPNNRIPTIVDQEIGQTLMEIGAIMLSLGQKHGQFICERAEYWRMMEWLMWQMGGLGPMLGQVHHFVKYNAGKSAYFEERYSNESHRLYRVLNTRLVDRDFVVGTWQGNYSAANAAMWPWVSRFEWQQVDLNNYPNVRDWYARIAERPAVQRGYKVPKYVTDVPML